MKYIDVIQIYRGIAALMVVVHHSVGSLKYYHGIDNVFLNYIGSIGKYGVDFFFVLSGFIISYSAYYKYNKPNAFKEYVLNRVLRIYIPYLPIGILMLLLYQLLPMYSNSERSISLLTSLTLIPDGNPALSVAWTLTFELLFYLIFSISFISKKYWHYFILFWSIIIIVYNYTSFVDSFEISNPFIKLFTSLYNIEFLLGFLISVVITQTLKFNKYLMFILLLFFSIVFLYLQTGEIHLFRFERNFFFSLASALVIYFSITYYNFSIHKKAIFMMIGNATYSIYLLHNPIQGIIIRLFNNVNSAFSIIVCLLFTIAVSVIVGYFYYLIFEKYLMNKIKFRLKKFI